MGYRVVRQTPKTAAEFDRRIRYAGFRHVDGSRGFILLNPADSGNREKLDKLNARLAAGELTEVEVRVGYCYAKYAGDGSWIMHKELSYTDFDLNGMPAGKLAKLLAEEERYSDSPWPLVAQVRVFCGPKFPRDWWGDYDGKHKDYRPGCNPLTGE